MKEKTPQFETMGVKYDSSISLRFFCKVKKTETCWEWIAGKDKDGYALFTLHGKKIKAHRFSYELHKGPIPAGLQTDHLCRNRGCVNPAHLEAVTPKENALRGFSPLAINARKTHCPKGHPYSGDNLLINVNRRRICKICNRDQARQYVRKHLKERIEYNRKYRKRKLLSLKQNRSDGSCLQ